MMGFTEKVKCIENCYNVKTVFRRKHNFSVLLMWTRPERSALQKVHFDCSIPSKCSRNYVVTDSLLAV
jgi:hypothetical protein